MKRWGMPMGPFELLDEIGLDVAGSILTSLMPGAERPKALRLAIERQWLGKKSGRGFYLHATKAGRPRRPGAPQVNAELAELLHAGAAMPERPGIEEAVQWRLVLPMVNQAAAALRAGVVDSADTIDLATVLGAGLAPFRGGLAHFADTVGIPEIVRRLDNLAARHGRRFAPDPLLAELAIAGGTFEQWRPASPQPAAAVS
jgi:3-hydroxyacyl-CoA dehydrogenase/enoyl-CoA hydratase/3-hydroxybutyryl-CoA epimerase